MAAALTAALRALTATVFIWAWSALAALLAARGFLILSLASGARSRRQQAWIARVGLSHSDRSGILHTGRRGVCRQHHQRKSSTGKEQVGKLHDPQFAFRVLGYS